MSIKVKKVTALITQTRYVEIEITTDDGYDMPLSIDDCISLNSDIHANPDRYIGETEWVVDEQVVKNIEFVEV
jgi:hypothetical protein